MNPFLSAALFIFNFLRNMVVFPSNTSPNDQICNNDGTNWDGSLCEGWPQPEQPDPTDFPITPFPDDSDFPLDPPPPAPKDPLVLDLDGNGIQLTSVSGSHTFFDVDNDGFIEQTAWIAGGDGLLTLDKNGNGRIDDSSELFGTGTADGFAVLSQYDSDHNGVIDARDTIFSDLRVWHDSNADGTGELTALADLGIASINLSAKTSNVTIQGNTVLKQGTFTRTDGTIGEISAVALAANQANAFAINPLAGVTVTQAVAEEVLCLPGMRGYGTVIDLTWAMIKDDTLRAMMKDFVAVQLGLPDLKEAFKAIMFRWTGVDGIDPASRGPNIDARILTALEHLWGQNWFDAGHTPRTR